MPSISRRRHRNLPFFPEQPPSAYGCQQTYIRTYLCYSSDILVTKKDLLQPLSTLWELCSLPSQVHFAWHFYLCETGITLCAQAHSHPNTWARLYTVKRPTREHPAYFPKAEVWVKNVSSCSQCPVPVWDGAGCYISVQSWIDLGFVSQDNSESRLIFGRSSCYVFGRCTPH